MTSRDQKIVELIELLFFAYRDFVSDPDLADVVEDGGDLQIAHRRLIEPELLTQSNRPLRQPWIAGA